MPSPGDIEHVLLAFCRAHAAPSAGDLPALGDALELAFPRDVLGYARSPADGQPLFLRVLLTNKANAAVWERVDASCLRQCAVDWAVQSWEL